MNRPQLIQEIISGGFKRYEESDLIDHQSLKRWIRIELKRFGSDIMSHNEKTIKVENGRAKLPENFWKLDLAMRVDLDSIHGEGDYEDFLQSSLFYKERREVDVEWDNQSNSFQHKNYKCVEENIYLRRAKVTARYTNGRYLRLTKGFNREAISDKCHNLSKRYTNSAENEINIVGDYINTNFDEGWIYLQYSGLPTDEEGEFIIPECNHDRISNYLITYCRLMTLEDIVMGDDDPNKITMLRYYKDKEEDDFRLAQADAKWYGMQGWRKKMKRAAVRNRNRHERMLPQR